MKMRRLLAILMSLLLVLAAVPVMSAAASDSELQSADALHDLGLFNGTGTKADGTPEYSLDKSMTRAEAVTMLVRLLGAESDAKAYNNWPTPFNDVPDWAAPYVGYAYNYGLTRGVSNTAFGSNNNVTAAQYLTFALRALGYESGVDFKWSASWDLAAELGVIEAGAYNDSNNQNFDRGNAVTISEKALYTCVKGSNVTLYEFILEGGGITVPVKQDTVQVSNVKQFAEALDSARIIEMASGTYNLSELDNKTLHPTNPSAFYSLEVYDGFEYMIEGLANLTIRPKKGAEVTICIEPRYAYVLNFANCDNVTIEDITLGHTEDHEGYCTGGVVYLENCSDVNIKKSFMYGCGTYGLETHECYNVVLDSCTIHDCTYGIMDIYETNQLICNDCYFFYNNGYTQISLVDSNAVMNGCWIYQNNASGCALVSVDDYSKAVFDGCRINNNTYGALTSGSGISFLNCTIKDNVEDGDLYWD